MKALLLLDDNQDMLFILNEFLKTAFDIVIQTCAIEQAERALAQVPFTHLVADYRIGAYALESGLLPRWRAEHPSLDYIAIFTGVHFERSEWPEGCDELFQKPEDLHRLLRTMLDLGRCC